ARPARLGRARHGGRGRGPDRARRPAAVRARCGVGVTRGWIVVFAKAPAAGRVKTRFSPPFSPAAAAAVYGCLLAEVRDVTAQAAAALDLDAVLSVDPPDAAAALAAQAPAGVRAVAQHPGALGERMTRAAHAALAAGAPFVLLRGSDSPCLGEKT